MRGLLPGSKNATFRVNAQEVIAPRFIPNPTPEGVAFLRRIELGEEDPPKVVVDDQLRLLVSNYAEVSGDENWESWKIVKLAALSYIPVKEVQLPPTIADANARRINTMDRSYVAQTNQQIFEEGDIDEEQEEERPLPEEEDDGELPFEEEPEPLTPDWATIAQQLAENRFRIPPLTPRTATEATTMTFRGGPIFTDGNEDER